MFRSAATKLAHNSTLPALSGNKDIRPLQDLITAEKAVLQSLQRLSSDLQKSNECLRHWGAGEGDDLQDTMSASATLLSHFSNALTQLATHEVTMREQMKALRSKEESLDDLKKRRKAVAAKAESAERKLAKMSPEHKSLHQQTELLNNLRDQIRNLDWEIMNDEAKLGDFKRSQTKAWLAVKFGGILEAAEKSTVAGEIGKLVIEEIPQATTQPGQPRAFYTGHDQTEKLVAEAQRCVSEIVFDPQEAGASHSVGTKSSLDNGADANEHGANQYATSPAAARSVPADEFGGLGDRRASRFGTMPMTSAPYGSEPGYPSSPKANASQFGTFPRRQESLSVNDYNAPLSPAQNLSVQPSNFDDGGSSFADDVAGALAYAEQGDQYQSTPSQSQNQPSVSYGGLPRGAAAPSQETNPWENTTSHMREPNASQYDSQNEDTDLAYASPPPNHTGLPLQESHVHFRQQDPPPRTDEDDEAARNAAAAREVAREMDALTFSPPPGPPPGQLALGGYPGYPDSSEGHREPSPLIPPAPPFAHDQQGFNSAHDYSANPASFEGPPSSTRPEIRGPSNLSVEPPSPQPSYTSTLPPSPQSHRSRPSIGIAVHSPKPSHSYQSSIGGYATPSEIPASTPMRTGSPASPSVLTPGGPRTISAAAFKRSNMRSTSSIGQAQLGGAGDKDTRTLPDTSPLTLRKKDGTSQNPGIGQGQGQNVQGRNSIDKETPSEAAPPYSELGHGRAGDADDGLR